VGARAGDAGEHHGDASRPGPPGLDPKKKTLQASEQDPVARATWRADVAPVPAECLVFVDESGASVRLTRLYARAPRGERAVGRIPRNHGTTTSRVAALAPAGLQAPLRRLGAFTADTFATSVEQVLCPVLRPG